MAHFGYRCVRLKRSGVKVGSLRRRSVVLGYFKVDSWKTFKVLSYFEWMVPALMT
jgi:hypothetical protein